MAAQAVSGSLTAGFANLHGTGLVSTTFSGSGFGAADGGSMAKAPMQQELEDIELKLQSAWEAAGRADATEKDKRHRLTASRWQEGVGQEARRGA